MQTYIVLAELVDGDSTHVLRAVAAFQDMPETAILLFLDVA